MQLVYSHRNKDPSALFKYKSINILYIAILWFKITNREMECDYCCENEATLRCPSCLVGKWCSDKCEIKDRKEHEARCFDYKNPERAKVVAAYIACRGRFSDTEDDSEDDFIEYSMPPSDDFYFDEDLLSEDSEDVIDDWEHEDMSIADMIGQMVVENIGWKGKSKKKKKKKSKLSRKKQGQRQAWKGHRAAKRGQKYWSKGRWKEARKARKAKKEYYK